MLPGNVHNRAARRAGNSVPSLCARVPTQPGSSRAPGRTASEVVQIRESRTLGCRGCTNRHREPSKDASRNREEHGQLSQNPRARATGVIVPVTVTARAVNLVVCSGRRWKRGERPKPVPPPRDLPGVTELQVGSTSSHHPALVRGRRHHRECGLR